MRKTDVLKLRFSKLKKSVTSSVFGELQLTQISLNFKTSCCNLKIRGLGANTCVERNYEVLKSKDPCILLNRDIKLKRNRKFKIPYTVLERRSLCFSSNKNSKSKSKTMMSWSSRKKKEDIFCFCPIETFLTFVFYVNVSCIEHTFRKNILSPITKH